MSTPAGTKTTLGRVKGAFRYNGPKSGSGDGSGVGLGRWAVATRRLLGDGTTLLVFIGLVALWELIVRVFAIPVYLVPPPSAIAGRIARDWSVLVQHFSVTAWEVILGFLVSVAIGIPLAMGIVYSRLFERLAYGLIVSSQTIPKVALAPLVVVWVGYGLASKVFVAFLVAFFPIVINTVVGMRSIEREMIYLAQSLGAKPLQVFLKFRLPKALPVIFGGLRVGVTLSVVGAVVGEFIAANRGLGYLQLVANGNLDTVLLFSTVVLLSLLGLVLFGIIVALERLVIHWRPPDMTESAGTM